MSLKMPKGLEDLVILDKENQLIRNPLSGETCMLTPQATAVYDFIKGSEIRGMQVRLRGVALQWFIKHYPKEYFILLD